MTGPPEEIEDGLDPERTAEIGLAILSLTRWSEDFGTERVWKGLSWDLLDALHRRGWIANPVGRAKSVLLTPDGARAAERARGTWLARVLDVATVRPLEEGMWTFERRGDPEWFDAHVHADFVEVGRSGRRYVRSDMFPVDVEPFEAVVPLARYRARELAPGTVLTTYDSEATYPSGVERAHRSSTWVHEGGRWQLLYHQGTPFD